MQPPLPTLAHSVTLVPDEGLDQVLVCGSHAGRYAAACALELGVPAVVFNDAGRGLDDAGIAGLALLQAHGVPAAAVSHRSACIGHAGDSWARGRISVCNGLAAARGVRAGQSVPEACALLPRGRHPGVTLPVLSDARHAIDTHPGVPVCALDSTASVDVQDIGTIVLTGSHGGIHGGDPATAINHPVFAAFFNDAGVGIDEAGTSRLPVLQARGIAGITVDAATARVGDGVSTWRDGVVSCANGRAQALGVAVGMRAQDAVAWLAQAWRAHALQRGGAAG